MCFSPTVQEAKLASAFGLLQACPWAFQLSNHFETYDSASLGSRFGGPWRTASLCTAGHGPPDGAGNQEAPSWGGTAAPLWKWRAPRSRSCRWRPAFGSWWHCASHGGTVRLYSPPLLGYKKREHLASKLHFFYELKHLKEIVSRREKKLKERARVQLCMLWALKKKKILPGFAFLYTRCGSSEANSV